MEEMPLEVAAMAAAGAVAGAELVGGVEVAARAAPTTAARRPPEEVRSCDDRGCYLVAYVPIGHRAWAVCQEPRG